jgi:hypothetical protein
LTGSPPIWNQNTTGTATNITAASNSTLITLPALELPYTQLTGTPPTWNQNTTGNAANITASTNATITTLLALELPWAQISGTVPTWNQNTLGTAANITAATNTTLITLTALALPYAQLIGTPPTWNQNTTGTAANITATTNSTLTTLPDLIMLYSQLSGTPPTWNQNTTGTAANVTGIVGIPNGGTGQVTANAAINALLPSQSPNTGKVLATDGTNTFWAAAGIGSVSSFTFTNGGGFTGSVATPTTTPTLSLTATLSGDVTGPLTATVLSATTNSTLTTLSALMLPYGQLSGTVPTWNQNTTGTAANITASSNATLTTLSALVLPTSQLSGTLLAAQFPALTGDVTTTAGSLVSLISVGAVTDTKASLSNKPAVTVVATSNITLSGLQTIDGQAVTATSTVLAAGQSTASQNGPWQVSAGAWTRPTWYPSGGTTQAFQFITMLIRLGTTYQGSVWRMTTAGPVTIDTTATTWVVTPVALNASTITGNAISTGAITGTSLTDSSLTLGSVVFVGASGLLTQDNAQFFWDDTNHTLGLGTATPQAASILTGINTSGAARPIWLFGFGTGSNVGVRGDFARGTVGTPAAAQAGDVLNMMSGRGYGTSQFAVGSTGNIQLVAGETFTNTSNATYIAFKTTPTGSVTLAERMRIAPTGNVLIGTTTDNGTEALQLATGAGLAANYTRYVGSSSGYVDVIAPTAPTSYNMVWPSAQGAANSYPINDGAGNLSWTTGTPPAVSQNIDGGSSATLYTTPQLVNGGTP